MFPTSEHTLQAFNIYIATKTDDIPKDDVLTIMGCLKENLNSPFHLNRILALKIFDKLNKNLSGDNINQV